MPEPNDDLFNQSTMTFGEHLEELRQALFRALSGVAVGLVLGLFVASSVVKFIQGPLEKALEKFYLVNALEEMNASPEMLVTVSEDRLIRDTVQIDPFRLLDSLKRTYPEHFDELNYSQYIFVAADIKDAQARALCKALKDAEEGPVSVVWSQFDQPTQALFSKLASSKTALTFDQKQQIVGALNAVLPNRKIYDAKSFRGLEIDSVSLDPTSMLGIPLFNSNKEDAYKAQFKAAKQELESELDASYEIEKARRLNRLQISWALGEHLRRPRPQVVNLPTWKSVDVRLQSLSAQEAFMIWLKAALVTGIIITSPWIFWQVWMFVAAGLYPHEKRYVHIYLPFSIGLFLAGAALAYFFVFEPVLDFLFAFNRALDVDPDPRIGEWIGFVLLLPLGFGLSFQLPLVMLFLERIGILSIESYLTKWRIAVLAIFVISMLLTPADPVSMLLMAVPLSILYFLGVALCKWMPKGRSRFSDDAADW